MINLFFIYSKLIIIKNDSVKKPLFMFQLNMDIGVIKFYLRLMAISFNQLYSISNAEILKLVVDSTRFLGVSIINNEPRF